MAKVDAGENDHAQQQAGGHLNRVVGCHPVAGDDQQGGDGDGDGRHRRGGEQTPGEGDQWVGR